MFCLQRLIGRPALVRVLPVLGMKFEGSHRVSYVRLLIFSVLTLPVTNANLFAQGRSMTSTTISISSAGIPMSTVAFGSVVTLTATVNATAGLVTPGQVNFCDASATICAGTSLLATAN